MTHKDSYDDYLTVRQGSQEVQVTGLNMGTRGRHTSPVEFDVVVTINESSSIYELSLKRLQVQWNQVGRLVMES